MASTKASSSPAFHNFQHNTVLMYHNCLCSSTCPQSLGQLPLKSIGLEDNRIGGTLPPSWSALGQLSELALDNNRLTGTLPQVAHTAGAGPAGQRTSRGAGARFSRSSGSSCHA